jgi:hypothetical protein
VDRAHGCQSITVSSRSFIDILHDWLGRKKEKGLGERARTINL